MLSRRPPLPSPPHREPRGAAGPWMVRRPAHLGPVEGGPLGLAGGTCDYRGYLRGHQALPLAAQGVGRRSGKGRLTSDQSRAAHSGGQVGPWQASRTGGRGCGQELSSRIFSSAADTRRRHTTERLRTPASQLRLQRDQFPTTQLWGQGADSAGRAPAPAPAQPPPQQPEAPTWGREAQHPREKHLARAYPLRFQESPGSTLGSSHPNPGTT